MSNSNSAGLGRIAIILLLILGLAGTTNATNHKHFFPLVVGNTWTYTNGSVERTFTITGTQQIKENTYYEFDDYVSVCGFPGDSEYPDDDQLFRYDPNSDKILQYCPSTGQDIVRYDFSGNMWGPYGNQLVQAGISCTVPAGQFDNCCEFEFAMLVDCGLFFETLAPGIGNIEFTEFSSHSGHFELQHYSVVAEPYCGDPNHPYPVGDLNNDCTVDFLDFAILASHWLEDNRPTDNGDL